MRAAARRAEKLRNAETQPSLNNVTKINVAVFKWATNAFASRANQATKSAAKWPVENHVSVLKLGKCVSVYPAKKKLRSRRIRRRIKKLAVSKWEIRLSASLASKTVAKWKEGIVSVSKWEGSLFVSHSKRQVQTQSAQLANSAATGQKSVKEVLLHVMERIAVVSSLATSAFAFLASPTKKSVASRPMEKLASVSK